MSIDITSTSNNHYNLFDVEVFICRCVDLDSSHKK